MSNPPRDPLAADMHAFTDELENLEQLVFEAEAKARAALEQDPSEQFAFATVPLELRVMAIRDHDGRNEPCITTTVLGLLKPQRP